MKYCWLDLETTGLKISQNNEIVEIAAIITEGLFNKVDSFHAIIKPSSKCQWHHEVVEMHSKSGLLPEVLQATRPLIEVLPEFINFLKKHGADEHALTPVGNSVHFDIKFLVNADQRFDTLFFHRHLDVSSIRVAAIELYGAQARAPGTPNHRAMNDLDSSMSELNFYLKNCFKPVWTSQSKL